jgi:hypothetical protein
MKESRSRTTVAAVGFEVAIEIYFYILKIFY